MNIIRYSLLGEIAAVLLEKVSHLRIGGNCQNSQQSQLCMKATVKPVKGSEKNKTRKASPQTDRTWDKC